MKIKWGTNSAFAQKIISVTQAMQRTYRQCIVICIGKSDLSKVDFKVMPSSTSLFLYLVLASFEPVFALVLGYSRK